MVTETIKVAPCNPTIGKVEIVLNGIFKFHRMTATFPIDSEYLGISKSNLVKSVIIYLPITASVLRNIFQKVSISTSLGGFLVYMFQNLPPVVFFWIHLTWLTWNRNFLKELYEELKDIEYHIWKSRVSWSYKPSWFVKYLSITTMTVCEIVWEIIYNDCKDIDETIMSIFIFCILLNVITQYVLLLKLLLSVLRSIRTIEESKVVIKLTDKLLALCHNVNTLYGPQLFLYIVITFFLILFTVYHLVIVNAQISLPTIIWMLTFFFPLVQILMDVGAFSQEVIKLLW